MAVEVSISGVPLIVLAAGKGARAGVSKGLIEYNGRPWLFEQLRRCRDLGVQRLALVLGYQHVDYLAALRKHPEAVGGLRLDQVINPDPARGQFSSIQCGARWAQEEKAPAAFLLPVDVPAPGPEVWQALLDQLRDTARACVPEVQGRGGHPVLLAASFLEQILAIDPCAPDARLDALLHRLPVGSVRRVPVSDPTILMNINSERDWAVFTA